jgi:hypothetical protein
LFYFILFYLPANATRLSNRSEVDKECTQIGFVAHCVHYAQASASYLNSMSKGAAQRSALQMALCSCLGMYHYLFGIYDGLPISATSFMMINFIFLAAGSRSTTL